MNNARYFRELNFARRHMFYSLGLWQYAHHPGTDFTLNYVVRAQCIRHRRELRVWQPYLIVHRIVGWSKKERCFYLEARFITDVKDEEEERREGDKEKDNEKDNDQNANGQQSQQNGHANAKKTNSPRGSHNHKTKPFVCAIQFCKYIVVFKPLSRPPKGQTGPVGPSPAEILVNVGLLPPHCASIDENVPQAFAAWEDANRISSKELRPTDAM